MSDRKRLKNQSTRMALELKAEDQISLERDDDGKPIKFIVKSVKMSDNGRHITVIGKDPSGIPHEHVLDWRKEVDLYLPPKKDRRYAFLLWLSKHLNAPVKRA